MMRPRMGRVTLATCPSPSTTWSSCGRATGRSSGATWTGFWTAFTRDPHDPPEIADAAVHRGREAIKQDWEQTFEAFEDFHVQVEEHHEAGDELVVFVRYSGRGRASGARVDAELAHVWTFKDGTPIRLRQFLDRAAALEAAGL